MFSRERRQVILLAIKETVGEMIDRYRPSRVFMCTMDEDAPELALRKHFAIVDVFRKRGYKIEEG